MVTALLFWSCDAVAQDPLETETRRTRVDDWGLAFTPYAWFASQSTDVGGQKLRQSFNDLASLTNFGFQGRVLARWRWLHLSADGTYADMDVNTSTGPIDIEMKIRQYILDLKFGGLVYDSRTAENDGGLGIWVTGGARYWDNDVSVSLRTSLNPNPDAIPSRQSWWDPVLGLHMVFPVTPKVGFLVRATGGGFNIGSASKFMWDAEFAAMFRLSTRLLLTAGYRQFRYDRADDGVEQDVSVVGPSIGLSIGIL